ncbi:hypothetical protein BGW39_005182 [Mortierella sp. 14UC]|nr:hypothetical protein BGW39_005182 [Mortierella sp. 14UC]
MFTSRGLFSASTGPNAIATVGTTAAAARANNNNSQNKGSSDEDDFWLYFLCDCDFMTPESTILNLHVCSPPATFPPSPSPSSPPSHYNNNYYKHRMSPPTITYPGGYQLRNLDKFVENNALPMLSLLYLVEQANEDPAWTDRIRGGIRFLAERCREDLWAVYQTESDRDSQQGRTPAYGDIDDSRDLNRDEDEEDMEDNVEEEGEEGEDGEKGDEEAEEGWLRLREEDFRDPYRAAGKSNSNSDSRGSGIDGINFQALDLNRDQQDNITATEQPAPEGGGGLVLGADVLCQVNFPYIEGGILWLCAAHNEMLCKGMAAAKLRDFIKAKGGHCIPMEKSAEIQLQTREDARVFYGMLDEYKCVIKLKVGFEWEGGVMEEDLWELCQTVHSSTVRDLTIDCGGGIGLGGAIGRGLTFRPMLGMMCRLGFTALTVENFDGLFLSPEEPLFTQGVGSRRSSRSNSSGNFYNSNDGNNHQLHTTSSSSGDPQFLLQELRTSPTIMALPDNIQVKKLTFRHWARVPDRRAIVNLIKVLPNLTELEAMTDSVELLYESIQEELQLQAQTAGEFRTPHNSSNYHHPLSHLNLLEVGPCGSKVKLTLSKPSGPDGAIRILDTQWKTNKAPDSRLLQSAIGLETLGFTQCGLITVDGPREDLTTACNSIINTNIATGNQYTSGSTTARDTFSNPPTQNKTTKQFSTSTSTTTTTLLHFAHNSNFKARSPAGYGSVNG